MNGYLIQVIDMTATELKNDIQRLIETTTDNNGLMKIRIISPGWGSSGYYSPEVLKAAAPLYTAGVHCYMNHPSRSEEQDRPERSLHDLAGVLVENATWQDRPEPGLYARVKIFSAYRQAIREMAPYIGVSHYASGKSHAGTAGQIIDEITSVRSVDFVTQAGRGGAVLESARQAACCATGLAEARECLIDAYTGGGMNEEAAIRLVDELVSDAPQLSEAHLELRDAYIKSGMTPEAATAAVVDLFGSTAYRADEPTARAEELTLAERELVDAYVAGGMDRETAIVVVKDLRRSW